MLVGTFNLQLQRDDVQRCCLDIHFVTVSAAMLHNTCLHLCTSLTLCEKCCYVLVTVQSRLSLRFYPMRCIQNWHGVLRKTEGYLSCLISKKECHQTKIHCTV